MNIKREDAYPNITDLARAQLSKSDKQPIRMDINKQLKILKGSSLKIKGMICI